MKELISKLEDNTQAPQNYTYENAYGNYIFGAPIQLKMYNYTS